jgi:2-succinyl-5-enolpyruvyl-6-hydroxy-3-cyclohexene-1-carboxylate synthase
VTLPNPSTAMATVVIDELVRNGVARFVVAPGSRSAALALAAAAHPSAEVTVAIDERSAGFHALGMGKAGSPAAVIVTSGTAVANLFPAVIEAEMSRSSLVVLSADRPAELRSVGANQTIDQIGIFGGHVRWFFEMGVAEDVVGANTLWRSSVCQAVARAQGTPGGPVHLNLAFREPVVPRSDDGRSSAEPFAAAVDGRADGRPWTRRAPAGEAFSEAGSDWLAPERGVVVAGEGPWSVQEADRLAAVLGWPLITEPTSGGRPSQAIGTAHLLAGHRGFAAGHQPDVALVLGRVGLSRTVASLLADVPTMVVDAGGWSDPGRGAEWMCSGLPAVDPAAVPGRSGEWRRSWLSAERIARESLDGVLDGLSEMSELRVARDTALAADRCLVVASSMPIRDLDVVMPAVPARVIANRGASGIDGFVSLTLGAAAVEGHAVALAGDLSMLHDQNGFLVDRRPDAVFVVVDNDGGGIFSFLPQASLGADFERVFATPHGRSFERYAAFHDLGHREVGDPASLIPAIVAARSDGGIQLVVVHTDRSRNVDQHREVTAHVHAALTGAGL